MIEGFNQAVRRRMLFRSILFSFALMILAMVGVYLLYLDFSDLGPIGAGPVLGKIQKCDLRVRRKTNQSYIWSNAEPNESLFLRDSIQTGQQSSALVELSDGNQIELGENSLIVIDRVAELPLKFIQGSAVLHRNGHEERLSKETNGQTKVEEVFIRLLKPEPFADRFYLSGQRRPVSFSWMQMAGASSTPDHLEISFDKNFKDPLYRSLESVESSVQVLLEAGKYYWRVRSGAAFSSVRWLTLSQIEAPRLVYPAQSEFLEITQDHHEIQFRWYSENVDENAAPSAYLDLSNRIDFRNSESFSVNLSHGIANINLPDHFSHQAEDSPIFWRLRSEYKGLSVQSESRQFLFLGWGGPTVLDLTNSEKSRIEIPDSSPVPTPSASPLLSPSPSPVPILNPPIALSLPTKILPEIKQQFKLLDKSHPPTLKWTEVLGATQYEVVVYQKREGAQSKWKRIIHVRSKKNTYLILNPTLGHYSFTLRALGDKNPASPFLPLREFSVIYDDPLVAPEVISPEAQ